MSNTCDTLHPLNPGTPDTPNFSNFSIFVGKLVMYYYLFRYILHFNEVRCKIRILLSARRWGPLVNKIHQGVQRYAEVHLVDLHKLDLHSQYYTG